MSFPERLREARISLGFTQQQVADIMGITNSTYCGYETGKRQPDVAKIKQLASILKTSGDVLLETGFDSVVSDDKEIVHMKKYRKDTSAEIAANYELLNTGHKKIVENLVKQLLDMQN